MDDVGAAGGSPAEGETDGWGTGTLETGDGMYGDCCCEEKRRNVIVLFLKNAQKSMCCEGGHGRK